MRMLTVFLGFLGLFLSSLHLELVGLLVHRVEDRLGDLLLPSLGHRQWKVLVQLLVSFRQLQTQHNTYLTSLTVAWILRKSHV